MNKPDEPQKGIAEEELLEESELTENLVELVLKASQDRLNENPILPDRIDGIVLGIVTEINAGGLLGIRLEGFEHAEPLQARAFCSYGASDIGKRAALLFEGGNTQKPVVMGFLYQSEPKTAIGGAAYAERCAAVDGERLVLAADKEIVLQCGQASITLTRAGKILIRGAYVLSRSSGVNRIQGGSVEIN